MLHPTCPATYVNHICSADGNWISVTLTYGPLTLTVTSVYVPPGADRRLKWLTNPPPTPPGLWIIGGDWNFVSNPDLDSHRFYRELSTHHLNYDNWLTQAELVDALRHVYPKYRWYTRWQGQAANRLDRIYVSRGLTHSMTPLVPVLNPWSDHHTVAIRLGPPDQRVPRPFPIFDKKIVETQAFREAWSKFSKSPAEVPPPVDPPEGFFTWFDGRTAAQQALFKRVSRQVTFSRRREGQILSAKLARLELYLTQHRPTISQLHKRQELASRITDAEQSWSTNRLLTLRSQFSASTLKAFEIYRTVAGSRAPPCPLPEDRRVDNDPASVFSHRAVDFYANLLTAEPTDAAAQQVLLPFLSPLTPDQSAALDAPISQDELFLALDSMADRSPGPDGRTAAFWKATWQVTGPQLWCLTQAMENHQTPSESFLEGLIRLLPKKGDPDDPANYRPITHLQLHYKIVTKLFANRWRKMAPLYFTHHQVGFVPTRSIGDPIRLVLDTRERTKLTRGTGAWLFLDFQKAYDRVSWAWLHFVLEGIGSGPRFKTWMSLIYPSSTSPLRRIILNQGWSSPFPTSRGTAQGCPLSPFLYNLVVEAWLRAMAADVQWVGMSLSDTVGVKTQAYADDTALNLANEADLARAVYWLDIFQRASGARVNWDKSILMPMGRWVTRPPAWSLPPGLQWQKESFKYLGVVLGSHSEETQQWWSILSSASRKARSLTAIQAPVWTRAQAFQTYVLSKFWFLGRFRIPPPRVVRQLDILQSHFVWRNSVPIDLSAARKVPGLIAAEAARLPTRKGGLNVVDINSKLRALRASWITKLLSAPTGPWAILPINILAKSYPHLELGVWQLISHQDATRRRTIDAFRHSLPAWADILRCWYSAATTIKVARLELPRRQDLVGLPLALKEIAGFRPAPPYSKTLAIYKWRSVGDLLRSPGEWWTSAHAFEQGWLPPNHNNPIEAYISSLPYFWRSTLLGPAETEFPPDSWVARCGEEDGGAIETVARVDSPGWPDDPPGSIRVVTAPHFMLPSDVGLGILHSPQPIVTECWGPDLKVRSLQSVVQATAGPYQIWSPGLVQDHAFNPWHWGMQAEGWAKPKPIPLLDTASLYHLLRVTKDPPIWDWWQSVLPPPMKSLTRLRDWQTYLMRYDTRPTSMRELSLKLFWLANRPTFLMRPGPCPNCTEDPVHHKHILATCPTAQALWSRASAVMANILSRQIDPPTQWWEVVMGSVDLGPRAGKWLPIWLSIHGAALHSLHATATQFRHQDVPVHRAMLWHSFRRRLAESVATAYKDDSTTLKEAFWASWGYLHILASPLHPRQKELSDITLLAGVMPDWPT